MDTKYSAWCKLLSSSSDGCCDNYGIPTWHDTVCSSYAHITAKCRTAAGLGPLEPMAALDPSLAVASFSL